MSLLAPLIILLLLFQAIHFVYKYGSNASFRSSLLILSAGVVIAMVGVGSGDSDARRRIVPEWWRAGVGEVVAVAGDGGSYVQTLLPSWARQGSVDEVEPTTTTSPPSPQTLSDIQESFEASLDSLFFGVSSNWRVLTAKIAEMADGLGDGEAADDEDSGDGDRLAGGAVAGADETPTSPGTTGTVAAPDSLPWYLMQQFSRHMWAATVLLVRINVAVGVIGVIFYTIAPQPLIEHVEDLAMTLLSRIAVTVVAWLTRHRPDMVGRIEVELVVED
jgi:hypothetical protein